MFRPLFVSAAAVLMFAAPVLVRAAVDAYSPPAGYYDGAGGLSGTALDAALNRIVRDHTVRGYDQLRQDLAVTDRDWAFPPPVGADTAITQILLVYSDTWSGYSRSGVWDSGKSWNREHVWPDSRGVGQPDTGPDFSDMHHLRAANPSANSARSNRWFASGGALAPVAQAPLARSTSGTWEPPDVDKGWIARALIYMATRYDGTEANTTDLVLVETPPTSTSGNPPQMGNKTTLLRWNRAFPPGEWERRRNQIIFDRYQHNRNPFIDHPEFADAIYERPLGRETWFSWRLRHFTPAELDEAALADALADPDGDGCPNLLEYALGGNPRVGDATLAPTLDLAPSGPGTLRFVYRRQRDRELSLVSYVVEVADTLAAEDWAPVGDATETVLAFADTVETVAVDFPRPEAPRFWRLRVTR